ncbi:MAG: hypothetical protein FWG88_02350 [Oscillospiraceae bacterium]|nr:hypothetical protein [Oscillospiraceae bacterium]
MLKAKAEIQFTLQGRSYNAGKHFRPVFKFGEGLLFSGTVVSDDKEYIHNKAYTVDIEFFTVEDEAYTALQSVLEPGMGLTIQEGSRITGIATLLDFSYVA